MNGTFKGGTVCEEAAAGTGNLMHSLTRIDHLAKKRPDADAENGDEAPT
jgi:hypothetical protein